MRLEAEMEAEDRAQDKRGASSKQKFWAGEL